MHCQDLAVWLRIERAGALRLDLEKRNGYNFKAFRAISSVVERFVHTEEVAGSIPASPITSGGAEETRSMGEDWSGNVFACHQVLLLHFLSPLLLRSNRGL